MQVRSRVVSTEPIPIEHYARMRAEMDAGVLRDEVLARSGLTAEEWSLTQREWLERMGSELERGRFELSRRYSQAFVVRQAELAKPTKSSREAPVETATPMAQLAPAAPSPAPVSVAMSAPPALEVSSAPISPWIQKAPAPAAIAKPAPKHDLGKTAGVDFAAIRAAAMPFMHGPSSLPSGSTATPPATRPEPPAPSPPTSSSGAQPAPKPRSPFDLGGTAAVDAEALRAAAMPFMRGGGHASSHPDGSRPPTLDPASSSSANAASPATKAPEPPSTAPAIAKPKSKFDLGGTAAVDSKALLAAAMPFMREKGAADPALASSASSSPSAPRPAAASPKPAELGATSALPSNLVELARTALPFAVSEGASRNAASSGDPRAPDLGLEQYASLCAELAATPNDVDVVFRRYGLHSAEQRAEVDRTWKERLRGNPSEYARWLELYRKKAAERHGT
jgi:hypothetical protein